MATHSLPAPFALHRDLVGAPPRRRTGILRRLLGAMMAARQRQADREIATFVAHGGGKFTDESEREIERRFLWPSAS